MEPPTERQAVPQLQERLAELLELPRCEAKLRPQPETPHADAVIELGGFRFVVEWKGSGDVAVVSHAVEQARRYAAALGGSAIPLVAVPFMGAVGRERCREADMGWIDLSGNARIVAPGLRVRIEGQPNRFKRPGRPSSAFAPKSARIARWLLMHPKRSMTQREIARATEMDEGFTSRIVARLEEDGLIVRESDGAIRARDPDLLLDAWREDYDFSKHRIARGHVPARSGDALLRRMVDELGPRGIQYAATGLAAAWLLNRFAAFRLVTLYLADIPDQELLEDLGFREGERGANTWLVVPNDEGVFHGARDVDGARCVHPVQVYLDLHEHPERANEAAERLRSQISRWGTDA